MIELRKVGETATTVTLEWDPVDGAVGYRFQTAGTRPKWSHSWNGALTSTRFAKGQEPYVVEALGSEDVGEYPGAVTPPPPPPPPPTGKLRWAPPTLAPGYETHHVNNQNLGFGWSGQPLDYNKDHLFVFDGPVTAGTVYAYGGRNLVFVGGEVNLDSKVQPCGQWQNNQKIGLQIQAAAGTVHLEGLHLHGLGMSQGLVIWAANGKWNSTVQIQNCRIDCREKVASSGSHTDGIQLYAGPSTLRLYQNTILSQGPCLQLQTYDLASGSMPAPALNHFERLNCRQYDQALNCPDHRPPGGAYALWKGLKNANGRPAWPSHVQDCWLDCANTSDEATYGYAAWADGFGGGSNDPHWGGWNPPGESIWAGKITGEPWKFGVPAGGDFVPASAAGVGYTSPGYQ